MSEQISRSDVEKFKTEVGEAQNNVRAAQEALAQKSLAYKNSILKYFGDSPSSMFAQWAEEILEYVDKEKVEPVWFFNQIRSYVGMVLAPGFFKRYTKTGYPSHKPPEEQTPHAYANRAMELISADGYGAQSYRYLVHEFLDTAASLADKQDQQNQTSPAQNRSVVYRWLKENYHIAYQIQSKNWWDHY